MAAMFGVWKARVIVHNEVVCKIGNKIEAHVIESNRKYNDLPELGKARVDKSTANTRLGVDVVAAVGGTTIAALINPVLGVFAGIRCVHYLKGRLNGYHTDAAAADARRDQALHS